MTIVVTGALGQVGRELVLRAGEQPLVGLSRTALDIADADAVRRALDEQRATLVINAAGWTAVDRAEAESDAAWRANRDGPAVLADACAARGIPLLHLSTDYVFDGRLPGPYAETAAVAPLGTYGRSKLAGEDAVRERLPDRHLILRVAWVFGAHGSNFVRTMLRLAREREVVGVVADQYGGPTHAGAIADALLTIAARYRAGEALRWGTYHLCGTPVTTWHGFAETIFTEARRTGLIDRVPWVRPIRTDAYPLPAPRPANSALDCSLLREHFGVESPSWIAGLTDVFATWKRTS
ncbi:dTDP-4-dehydrorhamnose reductase [Burkholderia cenocepacia]|uniref:dTDP-4-dehydrorhamnose reductase n=1 Tax=Burkholderia cenocepacia TaxID=95486 RepID=UPI00158D3A54|nr:dTDP-4-dehydrorhamnose reductase [Burkholderia cenocepacia]